MERLCAMAEERGASVVLITDQWVSPAAAHAKYRLSGHVEAPSAWDSRILAWVVTLSSTQSTLVSLTDILPPWSQPSPKASCMI